MSEIESIHFPNTAIVNRQECYSIGNGCEIKQIKKNGEAASVGWFRVSKNGEVIAEIKESVCNIYFKEKTR